MVDFTKSYRAGSFGYEAPIDYVGSLSQDGLMITGVWSMYEMDGTFEMVRDVAVADEKENKVEISILLPTDI